jgi:hypothetical protein
MNVLLGIATYVVVAPVVGILAGQAMFLMRGEPTGADDAEQLEYLRKWTAAHRKRVRKMA